MAPAARSRLALLITNVKFKHIGDRKGAEKDEDRMETLLSSLGYGVVKHRDLSGAVRYGQTMCHMWCWDERLVDRFTFFVQEMDEAVETFSKDPRLSKTDSVFVVIMSHGEMGAILGVDHSRDKPDVFPVDNIYKHLDPVKCEALCDKPKVIIIQACRGGVAAI